MTAAKLTAYLSGVAGWWRLLDWQSCGAGVDTRTGSTVQIQRPANFDDAIQKLGLEHALGSLRFMTPTPTSNCLSNENVDVANLPPDVAKDQGQEGASGQHAGEKDDGQWVPLHLQLGLPLAPAELCDLVCRYAGNPCHVQRHYLIKKIRPVTVLQCCMLT